MPDGGEFGSAVAAAAALLVLAVAESQPHPPPPQIYSSAAGGAARVRERQIKRTARKNTASANYPSRFSVSSASPTFSFFFSSPFFFTRFRSSFPPSLALQ